MSKIKIMPIDLANKIAAGEVVENQASVVKELVENSVDAQATKIEISLIDSGFQLIQVIDNGHGMAKEDMLLCFKPHATSKLTTQYDLFNIETLGFRGEALASIASIAKVKISSNNQDGDGYQLDVFEDELTSGYAQKGTKVAVYSLFYNVPARLNYLLSQRSELANITDIVSRFALTYPNIAFTFVNDGKTLIKTAGNDNLLQIISGVYSLETARNMEELSFENNDFKVSGCVGNKLATRSNRRGINIFVNKRLVFNKELEKAVIRGYGEQLMEKRYPIVVLNIECDFQLIDVNVHPAKREVRISKLEELLLLIEDSIKNKFKIVKREFITKPSYVQPRMDFSYVQRDVSEDTIKYPNQTSKGISLSDEVVKAKDIEVTMSENEEIPEGEAKQAKPQIAHEIILNNDDELQKDQETEHTINLKDKQESDIANDSATDEFEHIKPRFMEKTSVQQVQSMQYQTPTKQVNETRTMIQFSIIGQFDATYIIAQSEKGLHLIDQHAAMERINYEKLLNNIRDKQLEYQELIVPIVIPLTLAEKMKVLTIRKSLNSIGINIEEQANHDLVVRQIPSWVSLQNASNYVQQAIDYVLELRSVRVSDIKKEDLIMASCKMSLKANKVLSVNEQQALLDKLVQTENYDHCPHGRPIIITFSKKELEKMFKRIV